MTFAHPLYFILLLAVPALVALYIYRERVRPATFTLSSLRNLKKIKPGLRVSLRHLPMICLMLAYTSGVIALARPRLFNSSTTSSTEGIHIMMAMDISTSMLAEDLQPNRFEAAKEVAAHFINNRPNDNIGLVAFAAESYVQCPMTTDHATLLNLLNALEMGIIDDGTAIGDGLATAVGRLKDLDVESKVVIMLTDGANNRGALSPRTATEMAEALGVRVYTIGVGSKGTAPYPVQTMFGLQYQNIEVDIDEPALRHIAENTRGKYFRATDNEELKGIYDEIDKLEKVKIKVDTIKVQRELFMPFVLGALFFLVFALLGRITIFRVVP